MALSVRRAAPADADDVTEIYVTSWNAGFAGHFPARDVTPELTQRWRGQPAAPAPFRWWVAGIDGAVVGFAGVGASRDPVDPTLGELDTIAVAPTHRRRGVGRELLRVAVRHLEADAYEAAVPWTVRGLVTFTGCSTPPPGPSSTAVTAGTGVGRSMPAPTRGAPPAPGKIRGTGQGRAELHACAQLRGSWSPRPGGGSRLCGRHG